MKIDVIDSLTEVFITLMPLIFTFFRQDLFVWN